MLYRKLIARLRLLEQHCSPRFSYALGEKSDAFGICVICSKAGLAIPVCTLYLAAASLPPHPIAWYVKALTSEEELVGDTGRQERSLAAPKFQKCRLTCVAGTVVSQIRSSAGVEVIYVVGYS
jgi:hypothetical protein